MFMSNGEDHKSTSTAATASASSPASPRLVTMDKRNAEDLNDDTEIVTNNNVNDVSALDGPSLLSEDVAVAEEHKMADEDISILSSQVERHIFVISRWIHSVHAEAKNESYWSRGFKGPANTLRQALLDTSEMLHREFESKLHRENKNNTVTVSDRILPPLVEINPKVETSFRSLDQCLLTALNKSVDGDKDGDKRVQAIVDHVAQVPSFMKTILLIHKKVDRKRILSYKIVRRVMLSSFSVRPEDDLPKIKTSQSMTHGERHLVSPNEVNRDMRSIVDTPHDIFTSVLNKALLSTTQPRHLRKSWIVQMLETKYEPIQQSAVDYFELLSNLTVIDYILDEHATPTPVDIDCFSRSQEEVFSEVQNLKYLIPAMISLADCEQERVAITSIIQRVLDNATARPFSIAILFCDLFFHIFLVVGWIFVLNRFINVAVDSNNNTDSPEVTTIERFFEAMFSISVLYFVWRLVGEIFSTLLTSRRVFWVSNIFVVAIKFSVCQVMDKLHSPVYSFSYTQ
mmetsp:Transcript_31873/g.48403  ORF Transcript_31873/g.48403 Transcript_31873/m.48403 type:complete len:514 (-) Transcript_31873:1819-3360(-)